MLLISACGRLKQENGELETSVNYVTRLYREEEEGGRKGKRMGRHPSLLPVWL